MAKRVILLTFVLAMMLFITPETRFNTFLTVNPYIPEDRWAVIEDVNIDRLRVDTVSDEVWADLVQLHHNGSERWIGGIVEKDNNEWGFRFDPNTILVAEIVIEVWQTAIRGISEDLDYWLGNMACVGAKVVAINPVRVPQDHPTIQEAIDRAVDGGTILVAAGTYYENIVIEKNKLTLLGEDKDITIIDGNKTGNTVTIDSEDVQVCGFTVKNGYFSCILVWSSGNVLKDNKILGAGVDTTFWGIYLSGSNNNVIGNSVQNTGVGIFLESSSQNMIVENIVKNNHRGIWLKTAPYLPEFPPPPPSSFNTVYHNNFIENDVQARDHGLSNAWDDGYPSGGNYWSDYTGVDEKRGPKQNQRGSDGIGDTPYVIDENNQDNFPLMAPYLVGDVNRDGTVDASDLFDFSKAYWSEPGDDNWNCHCDFNLDGKVDASDLFDLSKNYGKTSL